MWLLGRVPVRLELPSGRLQPPRIQTAVGCATDIVAGLVGAINVAGGKAKRSGPALPTPTSANDEATS